METSTRKGWQRPMASIFLYECQQGFLGCLGYGKGLRCVLRSFYTWLFLAVISPFHVPMWECCALVWCGGGGSRVPYVSRDEPSFLVFFWHGCIDL